MRDEQSGFAEAVIAKNAFDLKVKLALLESLGLPTKVVSDYANEIYGLANLPIMGEDGPDPLAIMVPADRVQEARDLLAEFAKSAPASGARVVLLDWRHRVLTVDGDIPVGSFDIDMAEFRYLGDAEAAGIDWDFFITERDGDSFSLEGPARFTPIAQALGRISGLSAAYGEIALGGYAPSGPLREVFGFGGTPRLATKLGKLAMGGGKTGASRLLREYEEENASPPFVGSLSLAVDGRGKPLCLMETTRVDILPFDRVGKEQAAAEGEGDQSLDAWRRSRAEAFSNGREGKKPFDGNAPVVCERFRLLKKFR